MAETHVSLLELISISLVLRQLAPYLTVSSLLNLTATSRDIREVIVASPEAWRHLDLTTVKHAAVDTSPIDIGGVSWRAERMDEAPTEDDFYAGPLRGIFSQLQRQSLLCNVQTLNLDGLSVPADLVREIVAEERYNVRVLSVREAKHLNMHKLNQILRYIVRPTRAEGTPKLKALYVFGSRVTRTLTPSKPQSRQHMGVMSSPGAQIGAEWNSRSTQAMDSFLSDEESRWYGSTNRALKRPLSEWPDTLAVCKGVIQFDALLCRGPRHDITKVDSKDFLQPTIATIALGPDGCEHCHTCPEGPAVFGESDVSAFPLIGPAPSHSSTLRSAMRPTLLADGRYPKLILRCEDCLRDRWCEQCNRWWCEDCYQIPSARPAPSISELEGPAFIGTVSFAASSMPRIQTTKQVNRHCFGCGRVCDECAKPVILGCSKCRTEYCITHDEGCSKDKCGWCNTIGRRTRELF